MKIIVFDRERKITYTEKQYGRKKLVFLYHTLLGRVILKFFISRAYSQWSARADNKKGSAKKIGSFIKTYQINTEDFEDKEYTSFNDFFARRIKNGKRPVSLDGKDLISIADAKLLVYGIENDLKIKMKNSIYTVEELIQDKNLAGEYKNGICLVFRLSVDDCHRYIYLDDGDLIKTKKIEGVLHTVTPIAAKKYKVFSENYRVCSLLSTKNFGEVTQIEIGAILVGKINNHQMKKFKRGDEKGWFEFGGSTIVLLFKENCISVDSDIIAYSKRSIETKVKLGEKIGMRTC